MTSLRDNLCFQIPTSLREPVKERWKNLVATACRCFNFLRPSWASAMFLWPTTLALSGKPKETKYHGVLRRGNGRPQGIVGVLHHRAGECATFKLIPKKRQEREREIERNGNASRILLQERRFLKILHWGHSKVARHRLHSAMNSSLATVVRFFNTWDWFVRLDLATNQEILSY